LAFVAGVHYYVIIPDPAVAGIRRLDGNAVHGLILLANDPVEDRVQGLNLGADQRMESAF